MGTIGNQVRYANSVRKSLRFFFQEHIRTSLPLYVVPQEDVLLHRLEIMRKILKKDKLIVAIAEGTFRSLDMKKDKPEVRKALRWINAHISKDNGRLRIIPSSTPEKCAEKLLAQAPTTSTVFVTVLTLLSVENNSVIKRKHFVLCSFFV